MIWWNWNFFNFNNLINSNVDMDFLMIAIYKYLNPKIRIVLMSATINVDKVSI